MRIASLLPSATEILFAVGAGSEIVGVTHECDFPPAAQRLPVLTSSALDHRGRSAAEIDRHVRRAAHAGSSLYRLDERRLAAVRPDLIITQELCPVCAVSYSTVTAAVRRLPGDVPVLSLEPATLDDILRTIRTVGNATGHGAQARVLVERLRARVARVAALPAPPRRPRLACLEWTEPLMAGGHWVPELVRLAGGTDALGEAGAPSRYVGWDELAAARPEVVVLMPCGFNLDDTLRVAKAVTEEPRFAELPAAGTGRVLAVDGSAYFSRPGPRIVDGLDLLVAAVRTEPGSPLPAGAAWAAG